MKTMEESEIKLQM